MIDFRYHLVSLVAVFMALATGILVGSSLLNQSLIDQLRGTVASQNADKEALRQELDLMRNQVSFRDNYLTSLNNNLLQGRLLGHRVALVAMPGAAGNDLDAAAEALTEAGAQVSGRISVADTFFASPDGDVGEAAAEATRRDAVLRQFALPGVRKNDPSAQLAGALLTRDPGRPLEPPAQTLLTELDRAGMINQDDVSDRGDLAVLVVGAPPEEPTEATTRTHSGVIQLAGAMDAASNGVVVTGPLAASLGGAVEAVRKAGSDARGVSTVDGLDSPFGRVATAYALVEQLAGGSGQYGSGTGADAPLPRFSAGGGRR